tara:strand:- start:304 stop:762 length:459 start_codon:yes stop_codon:yes gene_type:complete
MQVLVSIQSLILVHDPYFNEPGYENMMNTAPGKKASEDYNQNLRQQTLMVAINNQIRWRSKSVFGSVILKHFSLKAQQISAQATEWYNLAAPGRKAAMQSARADLIQLLAALPKEEDSRKRGRPVEVVVLDSQEDPSPTKKAKVAAAVVDLT